MTTKRLAILFAFVTLGLSAVFLLPKSAAQPTGINLLLRDNIAGWTGHDSEVTQKERDVLGSGGTEFARKIYEHPQWRNFTLLVSIVLSGHDMSNSIHRPERCLDAQGWTILDSDVEPIRLGERGSFSTTRLHNRRTIARDGKPVAQDALTYYWFVGENEATASHWGRFFVDNGDRLLRGVNQRWAFITITGLIAPRATPEEQAEITKWVDTQMRGFIAELAPTIHKDTLHYD